MITRVKIDEIANKIARNYNPDKIILFGSYANGEPNDSSDIDLLIIKKSSKPRYKRGNEVWKHLYGAMVPIDLIVYTPEEINKEKDNKYSFIYTVLKSGQILYERKK